MLQLPKSKIPMLIQSFLFSYAPSRQDFDAPSIFFQTNLVTDIIGSCAFTDFLLRTARRRLSRVTRKKRNGEFNQNTCRRFKRGDVYAASCQSAARAGRNYFYDFVQHRYFLCCFVQNRRTKFFRTVGINQHDRELFSDTLVVGRHVCVLSLWRGDCPR